jgi:hypothetical protein
MTFPLWQYWIWKGTEWGDGNPPHAVDKRDEEIERVDGERRACFLSLWGTAFTRS